MFPAILGGFTLSGLFYLISISEPVVEIIWADLVGTMFYVTFLTYMLSAITFVLAQGKAHKTELKSIEESEKKKILVKLIRWITIGDYILISAIILMMSSMIYSGIVIIVSTYL